MDKMKIQIDIICDLGTFSGEILNVSKDQYVNIVELSKNFYETGFEMNTVDGGFVIVPPEIVRKSILKINIIE
jgi:hypothetical protein